MHIISLGANCHPAYWLRKSGLLRQSLPFDWLLMRRPHLGLDYVLDIYQNSFSSFLDGIHWNNRQHPVSDKHLYTEFFHHHALLDEDAKNRVAEFEKLKRRADRFMDISKHPAAFIYCYEMDQKSAAISALQKFSCSVDRALATWPNSQLYVYFMFDDLLYAASDLIGERDRLFVSRYYRDSSVNKTWGTMPEFILELAAARSSSK